MALDPRLYEGKRLRQLGDFQLASPRERWEELKSKCSWCGEKVEYGHDHFYANWKTHGFEFKMACSLNCAASLSYHDT